MTHSNDPQKRGAPRGLWLGLAGFAGLLVLGLFLFRAGGDGAASGESGTVTGRTGPSAGELAAGSESPAPALGRFLELLESGQWHNRDRAALIQSMTAAELAEAFAAIEALPDPEARAVRAVLLEFVFERWAELDPAGAALAADRVRSRDIREDAQHRVLQVWALRDPAAAGQWLGRSGLEWRERVREAMQRVWLEAYFEEDPAAAWRDLRQFSDPGMRGGAAAIWSELSLAGQGGSPEWAGALLEQALGEEPGSPEQLGLAEGLVGAEFWYQPVEATAVLERLEAGHPLRAYLLPAVVQRFQGREPKVGFGILAEVAPGEDQVRVVEDYVFEWVERDVAEEGGRTPDWSAYAAVIGEGALERPARVGYLRALARNEPERALSSMEGLSGAERDRVVEAAFIVWSNADRERMQALLDHPALVPGERSAFAERFPALQPEESLQLFSF